MFRSALVILVVCVTAFLILVAPNILKANYAWLMQLSFVIGCLFAIVKRKEDFLVFLFIVSLSFVALNINVARYLPEIGYLLPWVSPSDLVFSVMVSIELVRIWTRKTSLRFPMAGNKGFLILIGSLIFSYGAIAPKYSSYQSAGFFSLFCVIKGYLVFLYFYNYFRNVEKFRVVLVSFAFVILVQFGFMMYQWISGDFMTIVGFVYKSVEETPIEKYGIARKAFGTFNYPSVAAGVVMIIYPVAIAFANLREASSKALAVSTYLILILSPLCILLSGMRVGLIGLFIMTPLILYLISHRYGIRYRKTCLYVPTLIALIGVVAVAVSPVVEHWRGRFSYEDLVENSLPFRLLMPKIGARALEKNPVFGVGWGNGDKYATTLLKAGEEDLYTVGLHNGYMAMLVENGVIGLISYIIWYISLLLACTRRNKNRDQGTQFAFLGGITVVILVQMLLVDTQGIFLRTPAEYLYFCVCLGFFRGYDEIKEKRSTMLINELRSGY